MTALASRRAQAQSSKTGLWQLVRQVGWPEPTPISDSAARIVLPGIVGSLQAVETIKLILDIGDPLIGRLLLDSKSIFEDQLEAVESTSQSKGYDYTDLALLTDGLRAEREQGITIDVAYRYFATPNRKFIIADTPGHVQYTRNMVTGASTADLGLVLVDARQGLTEQSHRHAVILSLLRVPHLVLAVNKMDLVGHAQKAFDAIEAEYRAFAAKLGIVDVTAIPVSAMPCTGHVAPMLALAETRYASGIAGIGLLPPACRPAACGGAAPGRPARRVAVVRPRGRRSR